MNESFDEDGLPEYNNHSGWAGYALDQYEYALGNLKSSLDRPASSELRERRLYTAMAWATILTASGSIAFKKCKGENESE